MREMKELPEWERLFKEIVWNQLGDVKGKKILDFGSGEGVTANYFAKDNQVTAIEPSKEMLSSPWVDNQYTQIVGDVNNLSAFPDESFDMIICHNVLEYIDDKEEIIKALTRVLKKKGIISIVKHNRAGRVMQMAVLLDDFEKANDLLDGKNSAASKFGAIRYYEDNDLVVWAPELEIVDVFGIRTFWDLQQNQDKHKDEEWQDKMKELEMRVSTIKEYRDIAFFHHILLHKN